METDKERVEQLEVQLAGCGVAALGWAKDGQRAKQGHYGWSGSYQDVLDLREKYERQLRLLRNLRRVLVLVVLLAALEALPLLVRAFGWSQ